METIKEIISKLENNYKLHIPDPEENKCIFYKEGKFCIEEQQCFSETCRCVSHDRYVEYTISFEEAFEYLKLIILEKEKSA